MMPGNPEYVIYIVLAVLLALSSFLFYLWWKARMVRLAAGNSRGQGLFRFSPRRVLIKNICLFMAIILSGIVMLRPQWGERVRSVESEGSDVLVALDVSRSMLARDVGTSRLERAKDAVRWIAGSLRGGRIGLIVFAGDAFLLCPLTSDMGAFMMFLDSAGPDSVRLQGTDMGAMFDEVFRVFVKKRLTSKMLVLITDGEDNEGSALKALERSRELGVSVYAAGVGRDRGDYIPADENDRQGDAYLRDRKGKLIRTASDQALLKKLAGSTGGAWFDISDSLSGLRTVLGALEEQQKTSYGPRMVREPVERFAPFAAMLALILAFELMLPERGAWNGRGLADTLKRIFSKIRGRENEEIS
jgi:Ca-activated chloride channel family protein